MKASRFIRKSGKSDLHAVLSLIDCGRKTMLATGNTHQWDAKHPSDGQMGKDIANGFNYLVMEDDEPIATFTFMPGPEPTYANIHDGDWLNDRPYHVIHRVAGQPGHGGILYDILDWCFTQASNIRIDTHRDNKIMRHCLEKYGFTYCGIIHLENGDERVAYQKMTKIVQAECNQACLKLLRRSQSYAKIKNLVFDFGGVFAKIELQGCVDAFRSLGFKDVDEYLNPYQQKGFFGDLEAGKITDEEFRHCISELCGREVCWEECQKGWLGFMVGVEQANLEQLLKFKDEGYRLALLSNTNPFITSWFRSDKFDGHGIGYYIPQEHQYLSFEQKCMKPGKEIFEKMLDGEGFVPDETMFVDDGAINLNTAKELGMHTFQPINGENWGSRLEENLKLYK